MVRTLGAFYEAWFSIFVFYLGTFSVSLFGDCFSQIFGHLILSKGGIDFCLEAVFVFYIFCMMGALLNM